MLFDYNAPTDLTQEDPNSQLLADYGKLSQKLPKAIATEKKAHPWWTAISGIASSFIPFGLGAIITPGANALVQARKKQQTDKLNSYRRQLGLEEKADTSGTGLDLGGAGFAAGSSISTGLGRDIIPSEGADIKTLNFSGIGGNSPNLNFANVQQTPNDESYSRNIDYSTDGNPNAPAMTGGGTTGLEGAQGTSYFGNGGGGTGLLSTTQNGYTVAPSTSLRNGGKISGGKINAPSHEEGGAELTKNGKRIGIEVEGGERVVNDKDWTSVLSFLKSGKSKNALALLKDIDKRKPKAGKAEEGINLAQTPTGYYDFNGGTAQYDPNFAQTYAPQEEVIQDTVVTSNPITTQNTLTQNTTNPFQNKFSLDNIARYGFDVAKLGIGLNAAMQSLPQYQISKEWGDHMEKARYFSEQGLLPQEKAEALDLSNQAYSANVRDITNASGGNAGVLLGNLGAANLGRYRLANQLALADRQAKEASFDKYEGRLMKDIAMKKQIFDQKYNQALANKTEGMGLASDALANISGRADFDKYYGEGSYYDKLQKALVEKGVSEAEILKLQADFYKNPANFIAAYTREGADPKVKAAIADADTLTAKKKADTIGEGTRTSVANLFSPKKDKK